MVAKCSGNSGWLGYFLKSKSKLYLLSHGSFHSFYMSPIMSKSVFGQSSQVKKTVFMLNSAEQEIYPAQLC